MNYVFIITVIIQAAAEGIERASILPPDSDNNDRLQLIKHHPIQNSLKRHELHVSGVHLDGSGMSDIDKWWKQSLPTNLKLMASSVSDGNDERSGCEYIYDTLTEESFWIDASLPRGWVFRGEMTEEKEYLDTRTGQRAIERPREYVQKAKEEVCQYANCGMPETKPTGSRPFSHGWFYEAHRTVLRHVLTEHTKVVVELGSWLGNSTEFIAKHAPNAIIFAVDLFDNNFILKQQADHYGHDFTQLNVLKKLPLLETFILNMWNHRDRVIPVKMETAQAMPFLHQIFQKYHVEPDVVYVDADHHYKPALTDIRNTITFFPYAHIVGDDWDYPDVQQAVREIAIEFKRHIHAQNGKCWSFTDVPADQNGRNTAFKLKRAREEGKEPPPVKQKAVGKRFNTLPGLPGCMVGAFEAIVIQDLKALRDLCNDETLLEHLNDRVTKQGNLTLLHIAASIGFVEGIELLISLGSEVNSLDKKCLTPLHLAAFSGHQRVVKILLEAKANPHLTSDYNETALDAAHSGMDVDRSCETLLRKTMDTNS